MAFGLRVFGSHGLTQIDQDFRNCMRVASGSLSPSSGNMVVISVPYQSGFVPQLFVRPWSDGQYVGGLMWDDSSCQTARIYTDGGFEWVAFGTTSPVAIDGGTYGLKVFAGAGVMAMDSRYELARIQQTVLIGPQPDDGFGGSNYPQDYGFTGWGTRPWFGLNNFGRGFGSESEQAYMGTLIGSTLRVRLAGITSGSPIGSGTINSWIDNRSAGINRKFQGGFADVPLLRRYTD